MPKKIGVPQLSFDLVITFRKEGQFNLKGISFRIFVKLGQKGIVVKLLKHQPAAGITGQPFGQAGFARSNVPCDGDMFYLCFNNL